MLCRQALQSDVAPLTKKRITTVYVAERISLIFTPASTNRSQITANTKFQLLQMNLSELFCLTHKQTSSKYLW